MVDQIDQSLISKNWEGIRPLVITGIMKKGAIPNINHIHWWDKNDINSRIKAFDYLIRVYTDKVNKSVIKQD